MITRAQIWLLIFLMAYPSAAGVLHVLQDYPSIQAAIDAAQPGDTILVGPGEYREQPILNKPNLSLTCASPMNAS